MSVSSLCSRKIHSEPVFAVTVSARSQKHDAEIKQVQRQVVTTGGGDALLQRSVLSHQNSNDSRDSSEFHLESLDSINLPHPGITHNHFCLVHFCFAVYV